MDDKITAIIAIIGLIVGSVVIDAELNPHPDPTVNAINLHNLTVTTDYVDGIKDDESDYELNFNIDSKDSISSSDQVYLNYEILNYADGQKKESLANGTENIYSSYMSSLKKNNIINNFNKEVVVIGNITWNNKVLISFDKIIPVIQKRTNSTKSPPPVTTTTSSSSSSNTGIKELKRGELDNVELAPGTYKIKTGSGDSLSKGIKEKNWIYVDRAVCKLSDSEINKLIKDDSLFWDVTGEGSVFDGTYISIYHLKAGLTFTFRVTTDDDYNYKFVSLTK